MPNPLAASAKGTTKSREDARTVSRNDNLVIGGPSVLAFDDLGAVESEISTRVPTPEPDRLCGSWLGEPGQVW